MDIIKNNVNIECEIMDVICKYEVYIKECKKTITEYDNIYIQKSITFNYGSQTIKSQCVMPNTQL